MVLNLRKPLNLALLCYVCIVWVLPEVPLVLLFALKSASTFAWRAVRYRHCVRYDQAVTRGHVVCGLDSYRTGDKTGEDDGEDGCVNEKFHDWVTSGGCVFRFCWKRGTIKSIVRKIYERVFLNTYRGYLLSSLPKYPFQLL
jgi:hypothetical protein